MNTVPDTGESVNMSDFGHVYDPMKAVFGCQCDPTIYAMAAKQSQTSPERSRWCCEVASVIFFKTIFINLQTHNLRITNSALEAVGVIMR